MRRGLLIVFAIAGLVLAALGIVAHFWHSWSTAALGLSAVGPYLCAGAVLAIALFAFVRGRGGLLGIAIAAALIVVQVVLQAPAFVAATAPAGPRLTVMTANLRIGGANADRIVSVVRSQHVDVLMLQELTAGEQARLAAAGLDRLLPHHLADARTSASGTGLWTRWQIRSGHTGRRIGFSSVTAKIAVPGASTPTFLLALHVPGPHPSDEFARWRADIATVPALFDGLPGQLPAVVGGDFNATRDVAQFRRLLRDGYADAAGQAGAGWTPTYPSDTWYGPVIAIDHVLTRRAVATSVHTIDVPGSDHRALIAQIALPG